MYYMYTRRFVVKVDNSIERKRCFLMSYANEFLVDFVSLGQKKVFGFEKDKFK